jgi:hypothetical protein
VTHHDCRCSTIPVLPPTIDEPGLRRSLADIWEEARLLTEDVDKSIPCEWIDDRGVRCCTRPAVWILRPPCGCPGFGCNMHKILQAAKILAMASDQCLVCGHCASVWGPPVPMTYERL